jgi:amidase
MDSLIFATAHELATAIRQQQTSATEVLEAHLAQIARHNPALNAIITLDEEGAWRRARAADEALAKGETWGPLHGVPVTLKDVHDAAGLRSTMGYGPFADRLATEDNVVAARLKAAGSVLIGKTNAEIFPDNPFGRTHNPWHLERTPGASSSGAAAALAAGLTPLDIGSDIGGSIIEPAHYSGIFGMRPTEHRVPLGTFPRDPVYLWRIMGVFGPMARSVADLRLALRLLARPDKSDPDVPPLPWRDVPPLALRDLRIAWTPTFPDTRIAADIQAAVEGLAQELGRQGAHVTRCRPEVDFIQQAQLVVRLTDLIVGAFATPPASLSDYFTALHQRDMFIAHWERFFVDWDILLCPAAEITAPRHTEAALIVDGEAVPPGKGVAPHQLSAATGQPAVVMPLAKDREGLPIGVQLIGRRWDDERLLAIADTLSEVTGGFHRPPGYWASHSYRQPRYGG